VNVLEKKIYDLLDETAKSANYNIVDINISGSKYAILQILLEKLDNTAISLDDCAKFSRTASALLDVADIIKDKYSLEVSSPGINRPLIKKEDFEKFKNNNITLKTKVPFNAQKQFSGFLMGLISDKIVLKINDKEEIALDFESIAKANLDMMPKNNINDLRGKHGKNK
jgi:ribosome maturation factor RimP